MARLHVWIHGHVQGVFFRDSTSSEAEGLDLAGWVKNLPDGSVEAVFEGAKDACERVLEYVKVGPPSAEVSSVKEVWDEEEEGLVGFRVLY